MYIIKEYREEIIKAVKNHDVTIISAETGSGKSTQVPQFLAECYNRIVVTEPRIMAAKTLASRVAEEMDEVLGKRVGYRTGYDKCFSNETQICYATDGLQLIKTIFSEYDSKESVLIIDEVHEWNINMEVLVAWCKFMIKNWNTKVVIMSATMDTMELAAYFQESKVSVLSIAGHTFDVEMEERAKSDLIYTVREQIREGKNVLVFVPGKREISDVMEELRDENAVVLPLHGDLDWLEQAKCFELYQFPKVIVATNVAQTSITIPDIDCVVDTGEARITIAEDGIQGLFLKNISKADILQRRGRAGRTKPGKYFLCSDISFNEREEYTVPEIQRSILSRVVLQLSAIGVDAENLEFFHQPKHEAIQSAKKELFSLGAIDEKCNITSIGRKMVQLPIAVHLARMIVEARKYGVVKPVLTIASIVENGGLLAKGTQYSQYTQESDSDLLAEYDVWQKISSESRIDFKKAGIQKKNFFKIKEHIKKLSDVLFDIIKLEDGNQYANRNAILQSCLKGWANNVFVHCYMDYWKGADGTDRVIDKASCVHRLFSTKTRFVVGVPKVIEFKNCWGENCKMHLLSFVTKISDVQAMELCSADIETRERVVYDAYEDLVEVYEDKLFMGVLLESSSHQVIGHPMYEQLKEEYRKTHIDWQKTVRICGKEFDVNYTYAGEAWVEIPEETLDEISEEEIYLENGIRVSVRVGWDSCRKISDLKAMVLRRRQQEFRIQLRAKIQKYKANSLAKVLEHRSEIGPLDMNMGIGDPKFIYCGLVLERNKVYFDLEEDQEQYEEQTREALQFLFMKEVESTYCLSRFSHMEGKKKKKVLTPEEAQTKEEFDNMSRDLARELTLDNCEESLDFLAEFFSELVSA